MPRLVDPIYMKTGTTDILMGSSTGALYHQGTILPDTSSLNTLSNITLSSGGTVDFGGAFQHKFTSTANSAVTLPAATDATMMWTTEVSGKITAPTSQINVLGVVTWPSTAAQTLVNTTDVQTLTNKTIVNTVETLTASSGGVTPSTAVAYGITRVSVAAGDPSTSPLLVTLAAPIAGVEKTIIFETTAAYINTLDVDLGAGVGVGHVTGSTTARFIGFSTLATEFQAVTLVGLSTALWGVKSVDSTVGGFGSGAGIRSLTAARTS